MSTQYFSGMRRERRTHWRMPALALAVLIALPHGRALASPPPPIPSNMSRPSKMKWSAKMDLALSTLPGKATHLSAYKKKVTLLVLWALYCEPCLVELPFVDALYRKFRNDADVAILSINEDSAVAKPDLTAIRALVAQHKLEVPILLDNRHELTALVKKAYDTQQVPVPFMMVLRDDKPIWGRLGFNVTQSEEDFVKAYSALLEKARAGDDELALPMPAPTALMSSAGEIRFPWVKKELFEQQVPQLKKFLGMFAPQLTDAQKQALLDEARAAVMRGEVATFRLPPQTATAPKGPPNPPADAPNSK